MSATTYDRLATSDSNTKRITYVEQCFGTAGTPLQSTGRVLVGEGQLIKMCRKGPKPRQFFLFNDILVYGSIQVLSKNKYNNQHILKLEEVTVSEAESSGSYRHGFAIKSPKKSFTVYTVTEAEKNEWMTHINRCSKDCQAKLDGRGTTADEASPVWIPDAYARVCMHCRDSTFTMINRRHHCRKCGIVACSSCTSKRWNLPYQSEKPVRVCLTCHAKLSTADQSAGGAGASMPRQMPDAHSDDDDDSSSDDSDPDDWNPGRMEFK